MAGKVLLGDIALELEKERQGRMDNKVPENKVERGKDVSDDIERTPIPYDFQVRLTPDDLDLSREAKMQQVKQKLSELIELREGKEVFRLVTPEVVLQEAALKNMQFTKAGTIGYQVSVSVIEISRERKEGSTKEDGTTIIGRRSQKQVEDEEQHRSKLDGFMDGNRILGPDR